MCKLSKTSFLERNIFSKSNTNLRTGKEISFSPQIKRFFMCYFFCYLGAKHNHYEWAKRPFLNVYGSRFWQFGPAQMCPNRIGPNVRFSWTLCIGNYECHHFEGKKYAQFYVMRLIKFSKQYIEPSNIPLDLVYVPYSLRILSTKSTISQILKIWKSIFHSCQHIRISTCKFVQFWRKKMYFRINRKLTNFEYKNSYISEKS